MRDPASTCLSDGAGVGTTLGNVHAQTDHTRHIDVSSDKPNRIIAYPELDSVGGSEVSIYWSSIGR